MMTDGERIKETIDDFLKKLDITAAYTLRHHWNRETKAGKWVILFREFSGTFGQRLLFNAHMAVRSNGLKIEVNFT